MADLRVGILLPSVQKGSDASDFGGDAFVEYTVNMEPHKNTMRISDINKGDKEKFIGSNFTELKKHQMLVSIFHDQIQEIHSNI
jgi:hypothetical protein